MILLELPQLIAQLCCDLLPESNVSKAVHDLLEALSIEIARVCHARSRQHQEQTRYRQLRGENLFLNLRPSQERASPLQHLTPASGVGDVVEDQRQGDDVKPILIRLDERALHEVLLEDARGLGVQVDALDVEIAALGTGIFR